MWVFTTHGFYSVVSMSEDPEMVLARARDRQSLERLVAYLNKGHTSPECAGNYDDDSIYTTPYHDYPYRIVLLRDDWVHYQERYSYETLRYPNFKDACAKADITDEQLRALGEVWSIMYADWAPRPSEEEDNRTVFKEWL